VQVFSAWTPPSGTLGSLVAAAMDRVRALYPQRAMLERAAAAAAARPSFVAVLRGDDIAIIAEIKRRSPSKGPLNSDLRASDRAEGYVAGGAAALSILTEPDRFGGSLDDLRAVAGRVSVPLLRKDFLVDPLQFLEARACGASAALLIVRALAPRQLVSLVAAARAAGLEPLVEVRDERELDRALAADARVIGVNNRDLETLRIDPATAGRIIPRIPADVIAVAESGISGRIDVEAAAVIGADAVLVGSSLSVAADPEAAVRGLAGCARAGRGGGAL
jgi:indole-3-glycerol phosphate synthase